MLAKSCETYNRVTSESNQRFLRVRYTLGFFILVKIHPQISLFLGNGVQQSGERKWGRFNFLNVGIGGHKEKRKNKGFLILKFGGIILLYVVGKAFCLNY